MMCFHWKVKRFRPYVHLLAIVLAVFLMSRPVPGQEGDYLQVTGPCDFSFPADHGPHSGYRTEWWYYTGNLADTDQHRFGFQLTFFRRRLQPPAARQNWPQPASPWRTDEIYLAHAALTDITHGRHLMAEKMARPVLNLAGATSQENAWRIFIGSWQANILPNQHQLKADTEAFALDLTLRSSKPMVLHGNRGYSRKGQTRDKASCYYSFTRLEATGTVRLNQNRHSITGTAWMDHEFSTSPLQTDITGWDWFSLQFSDQTEIMLFLLRQSDGGINQASSGTFVSPSGETRHLTVDEVTVSPVSFWESPHSKARYPIKWELAIPPLTILLKITANMADQEMITPNSTQVTYWEGSVDVQGEKNGLPLIGTGYVEMTGYAKPFESNL